MLSSTTTTTTTTSTSTSSDVVHGFALMDGSWLVEPRGTMGRRRKLILELVFGVVPMMRVSKSSVKVHCLKGCMMVTHLDNRSKLAFIVVFENASLNLLREWDAIHAVAMQVLRTLVKNPAQAQDVVSSYDSKFSAIFWSSLHRLIPEPAPSDEELNRGSSEEGALLCGRLISVLLGQIHGMRKVHVWLKQKSSFFVTLFFRMLNHFGLDGLVNAYHLEPPAALAAKAVIQVPDFVDKSAATPPCLVSAALAACNRQCVDCAEPIRLLAVAVVRQTSLRKMPLATDVMLDASSLVPNPEDVRPVLCMALLLCRSGRIDADLEDALSACIELWETQ